MVIPVKEHPALLRRLAPLGAFALAACGHPAKLTADHAWVRLAALPGGAAAGYLTIHGGVRAATLVGISSPAARRAEMHETMQQASMSAMTPLARVVVPAKGEVAFAPGGRHVMLFGVDGGTRPGATLPLVLAFADGSRVTAHATAIAAGDPPPGE